MLLRRPARLRGSPLASDTSPPFATSQIVSQSEATASACGHRYHPECLREYLARAASRGDRMACLACRRPLLLLTDPTQPSLLWGSGVSSVRPSPHPSRQPSPRQPLATSPGAPPLPPPAQRTPNDPRLLRSGPGINSPLLLPPGAPVRPSTFPARPCPRWRPASARGRLTSPPGRSRNSIQAPRSSAHAPSERPASPPRGVPRRSTSTPTPQAHRGTRGSYLLRTRVAFSGQARRWEPTSKACCCVRRPGCRARAYLRAYRRGSPRSTPTRRSAQCLHR